MKKSKKDDYKLAPIFKKAFEIQVITDKNYRRRNLATFTCVRLIEESLNRGLDPRWDTASGSSLKLALKFGYTRPEKYNALVILKKSL